LSHQGFPTVDTLRVNSVKSLRSHVNNIHIEMKRRGAKVIQSTIFSFSFL
jgi:hypothetical protein